MPVHRTTFATAFFLWLQSRLLDPQRRHDGKAIIRVDSIGYGSAACLEALRDKIHHLAVGVNVAKASTRFDRTGKSKLVNVRAQMYWCLREALGPEKGDNLALPPDPELLSDLWGSSSRRRST